MSNERLQLWLEWSKWLVGTVIVGAVSAYISWDFQRSKLDLETNKQAAEVSLQEAKQEHEIKIKNLEQQRVFLESFVTHAMSKDILSRIRLAHYVKLTTTDPTIREFWSKFYDELLDECKKTYERTVSLNRAERSELEISPSCTVGGIAPVTPGKTPGLATLREQLRQTWKQFECNADEMTVQAFGPARIRVAPPAAKAFDALAAVMLKHGYQIRAQETAAYSCRNVLGVSMSIHAYGISVDVNWSSNPYKLTADGRPVRFSDKPTQDARAEDVRAGRADTDMTQAMVDDVLKIETTKGQRVFSWGGHWVPAKDAMHFEIGVTPQDLEAGIDAATVAGLR